MLLSATQMLLFLAKIGTVEAVQALAKAKSTFKTYNSSMSPRSIRNKLSSLFISYLHTSRIYSVVKKLLKELMKVNGF